MLQTHSTFSDVAVGSVLDRILSTGQIAQADAQRVLQAAMSLEIPLTAEEQTKIKTITYRLGLGVLKVVY
ncbi:MAG: hypothetical protein ACRCZS_21480 [Chroococcidiopsis sp.]